MCIRDSANSVVRRFDKKFIVADNANDRVLEMDTDGNLLRGFGSTRASDEDFHPLSCVYNSKREVLTSVFTKSVDKDSVDISKISIYIGGNQLPLSESDEILTEAKNNKILEIKLFGNKPKQLIGVTEVVSIDFQPGSFAEEIVFNENAKALFGPFGIECFLGDFNYIDNIQHPIFVDILENGNWVVGNSSVFIEGGEDTAVAPIVEFDPDDPNNVVFSSDEVSFSDFSLGAVVEKNKDNFMVAGIFKTGTSLLNTEGLEVPTPTTFEKTVFLTFEDGDGVIKNAESVTLSSEDNTFGIKRNDTGESVVADNTPVSNPFTARYEFTFDAEVGVVYTISWEIVPTSGAERKFEVQVITALPADAVFNEKATLALANYRGIVANVSRITNQKTFEYLSPDGLYASDISIDKDGNFVIAESSFATNAGRIITMNPLGNITNARGLGRFAAVNDAKPRLNGNVVAST